MATDSSTKYRGGVLGWFYRLYRDGFRTMSPTSKKLWIIALIKLFIMFAILRLFFFPNVLSKQGGKDQQAEFVMKQITETTPTDRESPLR